MSKLLVRTYKASISYLVLKNVNFKIDFLVQEHFISEDGCLELKFVKIEGISRS